METKDKQSSWSICHKGESAASPHQISIKNAEKVLKWCWNSAEVVINQS